MLTQRPSGSRMEAGELDEVLVFIAPLLLGDGVRLFDHHGGANIRLQSLDVTQSPYATRLWYQVSRSGDPQPVLVRRAEGR